MPKEYRHDMGPFGHCVCVKCGERTPHERGVPCQDRRCPVCGAKLLREGSRHHRLFLEKQRAKEEKKKPD